MAKDVIMPALGMAQETGTLLRWLKQPGEAVEKGEPLMEVETDKAAVEIEAPASGVLAAVTAQIGDVIPVGQRIALILAPGEKEKAAAPQTSGEKAPQKADDKAVERPGVEVKANKAQSPVAANGPSRGAGKAAPSTPVTATPLAARMAAEHRLDLAEVRPGGGTVQKEDVLAFLAARKKAAGGALAGTAATPLATTRSLASPKARRLAKERGLNLAAITGSGPEGAVLAADVLAFSPPSPIPEIEERQRVEEAETAPAVKEQPPEQPSEASGVSRVWRVMVERLTQAWTTVPQFYLAREVDASGLSAWRASAQKRLEASHPGAPKITYTDLLVRLAAAALARHPRLNASWQNGAIVTHPEINIALAIAVDEGLVAPAIAQADRLGLAELAARRAELVARAQAGKLTPAELSSGTFTISNLGMYGVDAFAAIVNPPQAAILAVSRIAERVVPVDGQPAVRPMLTLTLTCDHRAVDGARGAQFLQTLAELIEDPLRAMD